MKSWSTGRLASTIDRLRPSTSSWARSAISARISDGADEQMLV